MKEQFVFTNFMMSDSMTLDQANQIWEDCYVLDKWNDYTSDQRLEAIRVRNEGVGGYGIWCISDRD